MQARDKMRFCSREADGGAGGRNGGEWENQEDERVRNKNKTMATQGIA
jgi:hypothetical protein